MSELWNGFKVTSNHTMPCAVRNRHVRLTSSVSNSLEVQLVGMGRRCRPAKQSQEKNY